MGSFFRFDDLIGKTAEEAEELIKGHSYELKVGNAPIKTTEGANKVIQAVIEDGKIVSYKIL